MAYLKHEAPVPEAGASQEKQLAQVTDFLAQHIEELQYVLRHLSAENFSEHAWAGLQPAMTFDDTPTSGSANPVTSDGIYKALKNAGSMAKLWENTAPGERMGRTEVTIPGIAQYDLIGVAFAQAASNPYSKERFVQFTPYITGSLLRAVHIYHDENRDEIRTRVVRMDANGVTFYVSIDESGNTSDFWLIPLAVYGVKF